MKLCISILLIGLFGFSLAGCGDDDGGVCDEACGIIKDLCDGNADEGVCKSDCKEKISTLTQDEIDAIMLCLKAATTADAGALCVGETSICD